MERAFSDRRRFFFVRDLVLELNPFVFGLPEGRWQYCAEP